MLFQLHSPMNTNDLRRAIDEIRMLLLNQDVSLVSEVYMGMTVWCGDRQLEFKNEAGQYEPIKVEPYPDGNLWDCSGDGQFHLITPAPPKRTTTHHPEARAKT